MARGGHDAGAFARRALLSAAAAVALSSAAYAERQPYSRYESIVDRQMFGPLPPNFDPTKSPAEVAKGSGSASEKELTKEQEKVKSAVRFSVINVTPEGDTAIGFTDNSDPKKPVHYYLKVGESRGGWVVKEADAKAATMTVAKDGVEVSLSLGGDSAKGAGKAAESPAAPRASAPSTPRSSLLGGAGSLAAMRQARREREEAAKRASEAENAQREAERAQREAERAQREAEREEQQRAEREEQRKQLEQIREELRKAREERQSRELEKPAEQQNAAPEDPAAA